MDEKTHTALHWAAKCGRADDIEALTAAGAPLNAKTKPAGVTPLIYAASEGWDDCVQLLLAAGVDPTIQTAKGRTAREATIMKMAKADAESKPRFAKVLQLLDAPAACSERQQPRISWLSRRCRRQLFRRSLSCLLHGILL